MIRTLANSFGFDNHVQELVSGVSTGRRKTTVSTKNTKSYSNGTIKRILGIELENSYLSDPITFNSVNKNTQIILSSGYNIVQTGEDKKSLEDLKTFLEDMGNIGEPITFEELLESTFKNPQIFGKGYIELIFNEADDKVVDLTNIDPKTMDYARDGKGNIVLDENNRPIGFTQKIADEYSGELSGGDEVPEQYKGQVTTINGSIFILAKRIVEFPLYKLPGGFNAFGIVEPAYTSIFRKLAIEEAQTNSIYARGTFPLVDYVGNEKNPPTPQRMKQAAELISKFKHDRYFALPYYHKVEPVEVKQSDIVDQSLTHLRENQSASFGMPLAFATGAGEATNRATLNNQSDMLMFTLNDITNKVVSVWNKFVFKRIAAINGWKSAPKIVWNKVNMDDMNEKTDRLQKWVGLGTLPAQALTEYVVKTEELPADVIDKSNKIQKEQAKKAETDAKMFAQSKKDPKKEEDPEEK